MFLFSIIYDFSYEFQLFYYDLLLFSQPKKSIFHLRQSCYWKLSAAEILSSKNAVPSNWGRKELSTPFGCRLSTKIMPKIQGSNHSNITHIIYVSQDWGNQAFPEMPWQSRDSWNCLGICGNSRHFQKCLGNWGNFHFFTNLQFWETAEQQKNTLETKLSLPNLT